MTAEEIKLRRLLGQHLLCKADDQTVVKDLCGIQAQFMANAMHALEIRCEGVHPERLVKNWTLRGTVHVFSRKDLPLFTWSFKREQPIGFAHCQLRRDYVEGTDSSPVGYLEGIYVLEGFRKNETYPGAFKLEHNFASGNLYVLS